MWLVVAGGTIQRSISGKIFFAPCLGTDLYLTRLKEKDTASKDPKEVDPKEVV